MRLWHQALIPYLPDKQLGGQWVEIRMILGSITKHVKVNHSTVNYVNNYPIYHLYRYGYLIALERNKRGMYSRPEFVTQYFLASTSYNVKDTIYPEHNDEYLEECLLNLEGKGIFLRSKLK